MKSCTISVRSFAILSSVVLLMLLMLLVLPVTPTFTYADSRYEPNQLEITDVKMYDHDSTTLPDYHPNQEPITEASRGQGFVINALVRNYNYTQEHFDYITEVF